MYRTVKEYKRPDITAYFLHARGWNDEEKIREEKWVALQKRHPGRLSSNFMQVDDLTLHVEIVWESKEAHDAFFADPDVIEHFRYMDEYHASQGITATRIVEEEIA